MTFYIPPVFLFGNKIKHNQEEKKSEYKTAAETEIKVGNWNIKRIAELEEENKFLKDEIKLLKKPHFSDRYLKKLEEENIKLKRIISNIVYLYKEEPTELGEYVKNGFKGGMSN